jgi:hypothetical protein
MKYEEDNTEVVDLVLVLDRLPDAAIVENKIHEFDI